MLEELKALGRKWQTQAQKQTQAQAPAPAPSLEPARGSVPAPSHAPLGPDVTAEQRRGAGGGGPEEEEEEEEEVEGGGARHEGGVHVNGHAVTMQLGVEQGVQCCLEMGTKAHGGAPSR